MIGRHEEEDIPVKPDLSIIIVNWNTCDLLGGCLESVAASGFQQQALSVETLIVDNASTDGSAEMVRERFPWARLIENQENVGFARANNQGIVQTQGRYVLLLNPDTVVYPGALETLIDFMETHVRAGACGARLLNGDGTLQPACHPMLTPGREFWRLLFLDRLWPRASYRMHRWNTVTPRRVEVIKGACLLLRQEAMEGVGLLDDAYFMYTEEVDLCHRLADAGWELWYVPTAVVTHYGEASSRQVKEAMYLQLYQSKIQFYRKFGGNQQANLFKRFMRVAYWPRWAFATLFAPFSPSLTTKARIYRSLLAQLRNF